MQWCLPYVGLEVLIYLHASTQFIRPAYTVLALSTSHASIQDARVEWLNTTHLKCMAQSIKLQWKSMEMVARPRETWLQSRGGGGQRRLSWRPLLCNTDGRYRARQQWRRPGLFCSLHQGNSMQSVGDRRRLFEIILSPCVEVSRSMTCSAIHLDF